MATNVTINGQTYPLPIQGDQQPWGEAESTIIEALIDVVNTLAGAGSIISTTFTIANNQASAANVSGLAFSNSSIRGAVISYSIYRNTSTTEGSETGQVLVTYKSVANTWEIANYNSGDAGVTFSITNTGQVQYISTNYSGTSYTGKIIFSAVAIPQ